MASNWTNQTRLIAQVAKAVALGDLSKQFEYDVQGEMLDLKFTINAMVSQLSTMANEITRVSLEVGTEGILGGQACVPDAQGIWKVGWINVHATYEQRANQIFKVLVDNVNLMAMHSTNQICSMADVTKAVASGDLEKEGRS
jgi:osomolarity two-component system sensor histidine kinase NIK1